MIGSQVNIITGLKACGQKEEEFLVEDTQGSNHSQEDEDALEITEKRRKSQPPMAASSSNSPSKLQIDIDDVKDNVSEEYVYKSPSKMTSPEKKAFS